MKVSIFTLTSNGIELASNLLTIYNDADLFALEKFNSKLATSYKDGFKETVKACFYDSDVLIFICATGIVLRTIAPLLKSKTTDPAVIVMDDNANNIISLLSGHIGGANEETIKISKFLNSNPVITTASDVNNKASVDMIAKYNNLTLIDFKAATDITARIVNGERVLILDDYNGKLGPLKSTFGLEVKLMKDGSIVGYNDLEDDFARLDLDEFNSFLAITNKSSLEIIADKSCVYLYPKNIIIGIGCRRDVSSEHILAMIKDTLSDINRSIHSVKHIATVDIKADEVGLIKACEILKLPLLIVSRKDILKIEDRYEGSDFVKNTIGVRAVSEPCCELTSAAGRFLIKKLKVNGATISIWEENY
ncbi:MAG: cobalt-precorrin 5A hydrolase [Acidaminobacteraceae bacterium]